MLTTLRNSVIGISKNIRFSKNGFSLFVLERFFSCVSNRGIWYMLRNSAVSKLFSTLLHASTKTEKEDAGWVW